jgi:23S rRNA (adenine-N6)-dimethyltransferase
MSARGRTIRDWSRRRLGQNFLDAATAERLVDQAGFQPGALVVEIGAGRGAMTLALARRGVRIIAVEPDPQWHQHLRNVAAANSAIQVVGADFLKMPLPREAFRVMGSLPFNRTTDILKHLLDNPETYMTRADVIVQWEVACKRAANPPSTLIFTVWAPWWEVRLLTRVERNNFRPVPSVDAGLLGIARRHPPLLPPAMARPYAEFVRQHWPFANR